MAILPRISRLLPCRFAVTTFMKWPSTSSVSRLPMNCSTMPNSKNLSSPKLPYVNGQKFNPHEQDRNEMLVRQKLVISCSNQRTRRSYSANSAEEKVYCEKLDHRRLVQISGSDTLPFLQGLITNDVHLLEQTTDVQSIYAMILNVQGRILYDVLLYKTKSTDETVLIECDAAVTSQLIASFQKYKLRKKIRISDAGEELDVWAVFNDVNKCAKDLPTLRFSDEKSVNVVTPDPRLQTFAYRLIVPRNVDAVNVIENCQKVSNVYNSIRYQNGIGEGTIDLPPGNSLPLESNLVFLNGVSFSKGCYVGQELTARTNYTGVIRKRLMPLILLRDNVVVSSNASVENSVGKACGKVRNVIGKYGLALLRVAEVLEKCPLVVKEGDKVVTEATTFVPNWWKVEEDEVMKETITKSQVKIEDAE